MVLSASLVFVHWLIAQPVLHRALELYLLHTPSGGASIFLDFFLPGAVLSWWNGVIGKTAAKQRAIALALLSAVDTVGLLPVYVHVMKVDLWWWPKAPLLAAHFLVVEFLFCSAFIVGLTLFLRERYRKLEKPANISNGDPE